MDTMAAMEPARELLDFNPRPDSYSIRMLSEPAGEGEARHDHELEEHDFDTFVEERLRDGTSSLYADAMNWMERRLLVRVLGETRGNKSKACQILGITRGSLRHKIGQLGIAIHQTVSVRKLDEH